MKNENLKIAMVAACPFPAGHGTPAGIRETAAAIAEKGHEVHIVTYHFGEVGVCRRQTHSNIRQTHSNAEIHRIPDFGFSKQIVVGPTAEKPVLDLLMVLTLCRVIRREKIDIIHAHNYEGAVIGFLAKLITGKPLIYNAVNTMRDELTAYDFFRPRIVGTVLAMASDYWVPRMADRIITISHDLSAFLYARGIRPERIHTIPLGIDMKPFGGCGVRGAGSGVRGQRCCSTPNPAPRAPNPVVIYTGILDSFQRIDYLLKAMKIVVGEIADARLLIASNIVNERGLADCHAMIRELGLDEHVEIVIPKSFAEIPVLLASADVAVISRPDCPGFPVKLLNYMAAGKAIVVFKGSAKGLRHLNTGYLAEDHDWEELAKGVIMLLKDRELAEKLGNNARQRVRDNFSWTIISEKIERVYEEVLQG